MAFGAATTWEVNSGGSDTANGGGFDTGATFATDLAATGATSAAPVVTSASYNFITRDNAQYLYIGGGTNWTRGMYPIASTSGNAATLNAAAGAVVLYNSAGKPTGMNTVAGCATTASPTGGTWGMDYSRGTAPIFSYADMVIDGTTNTKFTSSGNPVGPHVVGNLIAVTSGTGFTPQWVEVVSVSGTTATCDKSLGTLSSTGGNGGLGGALASPGRAGALAVQSASNIVAIHAGSYTISNSQNVSGGKLKLQGATTGVASIFGYTSNRHPYNTDTPPTLVPGANSVTFLVWGGFRRCVVSNLSADNSSAGKTGCTAFVADQGSAFVNCKADSFATGFAPLAFDGNGNDVDWIGCYAKGCTGTAFSASGVAGHRYTGCLAVGGGGSSSHFYGPTSCAYVRCISKSPGTAGAFSGSGFNNLYENCIAWGSGEVGFHATAEGTVLLNCVTVSASSYAYDVSYSTTLLNCADYNTTTAINGSPGYIHGFVTLSGDPFISAAGLDFSLNNTAGSGALLRAAGFQGVYPGGTTTSYLDIGAAQHADPTGGGGFRPRPRTD